jgi:hypothetical protein
VIIYRQGDVLIVPLTGEVPEEADEQAREDGAGAGLLSVPGGGAQVVHEEHATIQLPKGLYRVIRQREFDAGMARFVAD